LEKLLELPKTDRLRYLALPEEVREVLEEYERQRRARQVSPHSQDEEWAAAAAAPDSLP
jgi:hypothetical protein